MSQLVWDYLRGSLSASVRGTKQPTQLPLAVAYITLPFINRWSRILRTRPLYTAYALHTLHRNANFSHAKATTAWVYAPTRSRRPSPTWRRGCSPRTSNGSWGCTPAASESARSNGAVNCKAYRCVRS
ncbi:hypothetical protein ACEE90_12260 [Corynebacterium phoceense]|uniref:hypothetical protein n=1 Tax=Corynebacterium phoceense TaxID=1686286 RepID=UPI001D20B141|nr:hypothetical protein [Corynebacterium phoceense]MCQ9336421.1 hypothetical protein [Corynebacterium phoceense]HJG43528.1 hypothetical protein [Corynebacterium phoceense]